MTVESFKCKHCGGGWHDVFRRFSGSVYCSDRCRNAHNNKVARSNESGMERARIWNRESYKRNLEKWRVRRLKRKESIQWRIAHRHRNRIQELCRKGMMAKMESSISLWGCTVDCFKKHIEQKFALGMSWNNYGKWHIDHIKPLSKFDLTIIAQQKEAFNYTNLQPLWAIDNWSKSDKWEKQEQSDGQQRRPAGNLA